MNDHSTIDSRDFRARRISLSLRRSFTAAMLAASVSSIGVPASAGAEWRALSRGGGFSAWSDDHRGWTATGGAGLDPADGKRLAATAGEGVLICNGKAANLVTRETFDDVEVKLEFMIAERSNSGVKLNGLYEIQLYDSYGVKNLRGDHCGGIYPKAEALPQYHTLDQGVPPKLNAAKEAGAWQSLEISFRSPRFNVEGKKVSNAVFSSVVLNGKLIHKQVEVTSPTGGAWRLEKEVARGPLLLQGDHGPVAFRNVMIRSLVRESPITTGAK